jgi:hypothetical protein
MASLDALNQRFGRGTIRVATTLPTLAKPAVTGDSNQHACLRRQGARALSRLHNPTGKFAAGYLTKNGRKSSRFSIISINSKHLLKDGRPITGSSVSYLCPNARLGFALCSLLFGARLPALLRRGAERNTHYRHYYAGHAPPRRHLSGWY